MMGKAETIVHNRCSFESADYQQTITDYNKF